MDSEILAQNETIEVSDPMDYGVVYREGEEIPSPPQVAVQATENTQVYLDTHKENLRLPYMERSFISFSYGGKYIEDFGFVRTSDGDRYNLDAYASFSDNISESTVIDGQIYWSTHFDNNILSINLASDEVTEKQLDDFKAWFAPGPGKELILSEHPNRAIIARINEVPSFSMIPFEKKVKVKLAGIEYETSTTVYRGEGTLSFIMDEPHWYSKSNVLYFYDSENDSPEYLQWLNANGIPVLMTEDSDALKIIFEDGIIVPEMLANISSQNNLSQMLVGANIAINNDIYKKSVIGYSGDNSSEYLTPEQQEMLAEVYANLGLNNDDLNYSYGHYGPLIKQLEEGEGIDLQQNDSLYFYYGGTAPSKPILRFAIQPEIDSTTNYIKTPYNIYVKDNQTPSYNTITVKKGQEIVEFKFSTPSIFTAYNQAIKILTESIGLAKVDIRKRIREEVNHSAVRAYAIARVVVGDGHLISSDIAKMQGFLNLNNTGPEKAYFVFDSAKGIAIGKFKYNDINHNLVEIEENVGDMVKSSYLIIKDRDELTEDGFLGIPTQEHPEYGHIVSHNVKNGLFNFFIDYKFMYL